MVAMIGGAMAKTASNSFAEVSGEGVESDGEMGFVIKNVAGDVVITISERDGWKSEKGSPYTYTHKEGDTDNFYFVGREGEESVTVPISNIWECVHNTTNSCPHDVDPGFKVTTNEHAILMYAYPEKGCEIIPGADFEPVKGSHVLKVFEVPCPNPKCDFGKGDNPISSEIVEVEPSGKVETYVNDPDKKGIKVGDKTLYPHGTYTGGFSVNSTNECSDCCVDASGETTFDVCEARLKVDEYIGLDRTDAGYACEHFMTANVYLENAVGKPGFAWTTGVNCMISGDSDKHDVKIAVKRKSENVPGGKDFEYSKSYRQEKLSCNASLSDGHGSSCEAKVTLEGSYTVVKVDVQIEGTTELHEEERGAYTYYVPDGDSPLWQEEWTNSLKKVTITCEPSDGAMAAQTVDIKFTEHQLWVKAEDGTYEEAKNSYTVNELNKTTFYLHGHEKSERYKGEKIVATHNNSGATDQALYTVFGRPWLVPDYDRKNGIDDEDIATAKEGKKIFRFWINDDDDRDGILQEDGEIQDWQLHKSKPNGNCTNSEIDGLSDLVDITPVWLDISEVFPEESEELKSNVKWSLKSDCYNAVWTFQSRKDAHDFRDKSLTTCGPNFNSSLHEAPVSVLSGVSGVIPDLLIGQMMISDGSAESRGVVMLEGCKSGEQLTLIGRDKRNGKTVAAGVLRTKVTPVKDMIRWMNLRGIASQQADTGERSNYEEEPKNRPDGECKEYDRRHFIFVHGYNINKNEAFGWACEVFKRLWQSGYRGRFTGVDWYGDSTQLNLGITTFCPNYWGNVVNAFETASALKQGVDSLDGEKVIMAHSLGNMLVCSAIMDEGMTKDISRYYMMNAAVPIQALAETEYKASAMIPEVWGRVDDDLMSAHWYRLFPSNDFRSSLNWVARFRGLQEAVKTISLYSLTENVVRDNASKPAWKIQETWKGSVVSKLFGCEAGWAKNNYYSDFWKLQSDKNAAAVPPRPLDMTEDQKITEPVFAKFKTRGKELHGLDRYYFPAAQKAEEKRLRAKMLGCCIPATSLCVGANKMPDELDITSHEYTNFMTGSGEWPRQNDKIKEWYHSDFVVVAYYYVTRLYDNLQKGL